MVLLKKSLAPLSAALTACLINSGCGPNITLVSYVDTDTFISSGDQTNHSELPYVRVSKASGLEERTLLKLPTGKEDTNYNFGEIFGNLNNPLTWPFLPFVIFVDIFAAFFNCTSQTLSGANLVSSYLTLNVNQNPGAANLTQLTIQHVAKPWWQTVNWNQAFPFSGSGTWAQAGGELDAAFTPIAAVDNHDGTIQFDVTSYFRTLLLNQNQPHYGFVMRSAGGAALSAVTLDSVQFSDTAVRPRLVSTYHCIAPTSALQLRDQPAPEPYTYVLGRGR